MHFHRKERTRIRGVWRLQWQIDLSVAIRKNNVWRREEEGLLCLSLSSNLSLIEPVTQPPSRAASPFLPSDIHAGSFWNPWPVVIDLCKRFCRFNIFYKCLFLTKFEFLILFAILIYYWHETSLSDKQNMLNQLSFCQANLSIYLIYLSIREDYLRMIATLPTLCWFQYEEGQLLFTPR